MKKLLLSLLASTIYTSVVSAQTCQQPPSCESLGYTKSVDDCGDMEYLTCPFDSSKVYCSGGSGSDEYGDAIVVEITITDAGSVAFGYGYGDITVDCGNGIEVQGKTSSTSSVKCSYTSAGNYTVKLTGSFTYYKGNDKTYNLIKLNKKNITKMESVCSTTTTGTIPSLPSTLVDATKMFYNCRNLTTNGLVLPEKLEIADYMFYTARGIRGEIKLPSTLKSATYMFYETRDISIIGLENTQITDGEYMFAFSTVTSVSGLPKILINGSNMFIMGTGLTILPELPQTLSYASFMFRGCSNLTGTLPNYSNYPNLEVTSHMFFSTQITQEDNPTWPEEAW
ncbi:MAG: hypothetical protein E7012_04320 [Alphaproteobacteria bacterium]|nr:hypothetical protein [Alphaproteobacteria bacterium]